MGISGNLTQTQILLRRHNLRPYQLASLRNPLVRAGILQRHEKAKPNQYSEADWTFTDVACSCYVQGHSYVKAVREAVIQSFGEESLQYQALQLAIKQEYKKRTALKASKNFPNPIIVPNEIDSALDRGIIPPDLESNYLLFLRTIERLHEPQVYDALFSYLFPFAKRIYSSRLRRDPISLVYKIFGISPNGDDNRTSEDIQQFTGSVVQNDELRLTFQKDRLALSGYRRRLLESVRERLEIQLEPLEQKIRKVVHGMAKRTNSRDLMILSIMLSADGPKGSMLKKTFDITNKRGYQIRKRIVEHIHNPEFRVLFSELSDVKEELKNLELVPLNARIA